MFHIVAIRRFVFITALALAATVFGGCHRYVHGDSDLPNFQQVSPTLYRSGQPTRCGYERLKDMGIRTIVNLRSTQPDRELLAQLGLEYENRGMIAVRPSDEDVIWFLRIATNPQLTPIVVHCDYGSERSGFLVAMYRIVVEDWDRERAIEEMTSEDNGFLPIFSNLATYVREADIESIRSAMRQPAEAPSTSTHPSPPR